MASAGSAKRIQYMQLYRHVYLQVYLQICLQIYLPMCLHLYIYIYAFIRLLYAQIYLQIHLPQSIKIYADISAGGVCIYTYMYIYKFAGGGGVQPTVAPAVAGKILGSHVKLNICAAHAVQILQMFSKPSTR